MSVLGAKSTLISRYLSPARQSKADEFGRAFANFGIWCYLEDGNDYHNESYVLKTHEARDLL